MPDKQKGQHQDDFNARLERPMRLPDSIAEPGLLLGWSLEATHERLPWGFSTGSHVETPESGYLDPLLLSGEGHLITIAPTGTGKGRCCLIPALLRHQGPVIVIDPKGENAAVTARQRRAMGQDVIILDPFGLTGMESAAFNPLDLIEPESVQSVDLAQAFATALADRSDDDPRNAYWYQRASFLLSSLILHVCCDPDPARRTLAAVREMLVQLAGEAPDAEGNFQPGGPSERLARSRHPAAREVTSLLKSGAREGLGSILSMADDAVAFIRGPQVSACVSRSSFDISRVTRGDPLSIYLVIPPHHLESHGRLLRMWLVSLISLLTRRQGRPERSTLFLLDEAAQLGKLEQLHQAVTLLRGYGVQTWSFWQDVSQLQSHYPRDWQTIVNNCAVLQCFGAQNRMAADAMAALTGFGRDHPGGGGERILSLNAYEMVLQMGGHQPVVARKPDYLSDPPFAGQHDSNPYHDPRRDIMPPPPARMALHALAPATGPVIVQPPPNVVPLHRDGHHVMLDFTTDPQPDPLLERLLAMWDDPESAE